MHHIKSPPISQGWRPASFVHISRWRLDCSASDAWGLLTNLAGWPQWWPQLSQVRILKKGTHTGLGAQADMHWVSPLGYRLKVHLLTTRCERDADGHGEIEAQVRGDVHGMGLWVIEPVSAQQVDITYRWEVMLHKPWMRLLAPLLRGVFSWNHFTVMQAGAKGMARQLTPLASRPGQPRRG